MAMPAAPHRVSGSVRNSQASTGTSLVITRNSGGDRAGGLYIRSGGDFSCTDCILDENDAIDGAGMVIYEASDVTLVNGSVSGNRADTSYGVGCGVYLWAGSLTTTNVDFGSNDDNEPDDVFVQGTATAYTAYGAGTSVSCTDTGC